MSTDRDRVREQIWEILERHRVKAQEYQPFSPTRPSGAKNKPYYWLNKHTKQIEELLSHARSEARKELAEELKDEELERLDG